MRAGVHSLSNSHLSTEDYTCTKRVESGQLFHFSPYLCLLFRHIRSYLSIEENSIAKDVSFHYLSQLHSYDNQISRTKIVTLMLIFILMRRLGGGRTKIANKKVYIYLITQ